MPHPHRDCGNNSERGDENMAELSESEEQRSMKVLELASNFQNESHKPRLKNIGAKVDLAGSIQ